MAPAAFKATLTFAFGSPQSLNRTSYLCTVSDVNAAYYIFQDGSNDMTLPVANGPAYLIDVLLTPAYGTDTTTAVVYANNKITPYSIMNSANQSGNNQRQFNLSPLGFVAGARVKIAQAT